MHSSSMRINIHSGAVSICLGVELLCSDQIFKPSVNVTLPASTNFEYKYIRKFNGQVTWESDPNNAQATPTNGTVTFDDVWR